MKQECELSIEELAEQVGIPVRTIRFYITEGLLSGPNGRGKAATYGEEHLLRLRLIRRLTEQRMPLAEIGAKLAGLKLAEIQALLAEEDRHIAKMEQAAQELSPKEYISTLLKRARNTAYLEEPSAPTFPEEDLNAEVQIRCYSKPPSAAHLNARQRSRSRPEDWQRLELGPGIELHIRADAHVQQRALIERLLRAAGIAQDKTNE